MSSAPPDPRVPILYAGLVDDAALFPPGNAPMEIAVPSHTDHLRAWYGAMVGPFLCTDARLPELQKELGHDVRLDLGLIVTGGAGAIEPALTWVGRDERLVLRGVEIALRDEPDPGRNARRIDLACASAGLADDVTVSVEITPGPGLTDALDVLAETGHRAKLRTGPPPGEGNRAPDEETVARFITECLDREVPFKCTAGLHHAVRHDDEHGFLNILLATRRLLDGADLDAAVRVLGTRESAALADEAAGLDASRAQGVRRWFTSFGSCSIAEPLDDLVSLGLVERP